MTKAGEKEKTKEVKEAGEKGLLSGINYLQGIQHLTSQIESFKNVEKYAGGVKSFLRRINPEESARLRDIAQQEYQGYCKVYEDCRNIVTELAYSPSLRRTLIGRLSQLKGDLDSSYNTLNEFLEGSMRHA